MSGKRRKQQQRSRGRRPGAVLAPQGRAERDVDSGTEAGDTTGPEPFASTAAADTAPSRPAAPGRPVAASRYASSVSGPRRTAAATASTGTIDIDERVPYFSKDLRRIVMTAAIMVVLIIAGSLLLH